MIMQKRDRKYILCASHFRKLLTGPKFGKEEMLIQLEKLNVLDN